MADSELVLPETSSDEVFKDSDALSSARHARVRSLPTYHEDSGEYVSDAGGSYDHAPHSSERPAGIAFNVVHAPREPRIGRAEGPSVHQDGPAHEVKAGRERKNAQRGKSKIALEHAKKKDIKRYLHDATFKCVAPHDAEALSEFAYAPTDKGGILSVEKPFSKTNYERMKGLLRRRVKPARYAHSVAVSQTAEKMAHAYGADPRRARMAGLLHDWDKALSPKRLRDRIATYELDIDGTTQINMPHLLHGPTAAAVLADEFPEFGSDVFQAIARHTVGGANMTPLDMIVFCADKLEPGNDVEVYRDLYERVGQIDLVDLFMEVQREGFIYLLRSSRPLNTEAVEVWNYYCAEKAREDEES